MSAVAPNPAATRDARTLRVGILGAGAVAGEMAAALRLSERCQAWSIASRTPSRATAFADRHGVAHAATSYEALLADPDVDVVYVATPHSEHRRWATAAIEAGRHVLCEKPLAVNAAEAAELIAVARRHDAFLIEALAYRFHPQTQALLQLVADGVVGRLCAMDITFSFAAPAGPGPTRLTAHELGGGGILDVGCYCTSLASAIVAAAMGSAAVEPQQVVGLAAIDPVQRTDLYAAGVLQFAGDILAQVACGVALKQDDHIRIYGSDGQLRVARPCWLAGDDGSPIELTRADGTTRTIAVPGGRNIFALELDGMAALLAEGPGACHASWEDSLANMRTLDRWRTAAGVHYDFEAA